MHCVGIFKIKARSKLIDQYFNISIKSDALGMEYDHEIIDEDTECSSNMDETSSSNSPILVPTGADQLDRCGRWLSSIPHDDVITLSQKPEYEDFLRAFERLGHAHRKVISMNRSSTPIEVQSNLMQVHSLDHDLEPLSNSPLQHLTADDVVLRVFEFLECQSLIRTAMSCSRFRQLARTSATQRTYDVAHARQLNNVMQLLRAKEQIDGVGNGIHDSHVRVPILLLSRRVVITDAGDPEYNGVYFCTGSNGNGFVFTKPRFPERRVQRSATHAQREEAGGMLPWFPESREVINRVPPADPRAAAAAVEGAHAARFESEVAQPGQLLRCIIAKRFSNEVSILYAAAFALVCLLFASSQRVFESIFRQSCGT
jgi:hypothetical protein